jgi:hypothetical protein
MDCDALEKIPTSWANRLTVWVFGNSTPLHLEDYLTETRVEECVLSLYQETRFSTPLNLSILVELYDST